MKGDFSRRTFRKNKHYRKVNMQQGRVQLDADWNEQNDIHFHYEKTFLQDVIGKSGTLVTDPGFAIIENDFLFAWENIPTNVADNGHLKHFLKNNFDLDWITDDQQQFVKSSDGNTISISKNPYSLSITLDSANAKALLQTTDEKGPTGQSYDFVVKEEGGQKNIYTRWYKIGKGNYYVNGILCENESVVDASRQPDLSFGASRDIFLFNWNSVPGALDESNRLKNFLRQKFDLDWIITDDQQQQFVKSSDGNTISISSDSSKSASITLSIDNTAAILTINNDTANVYTFIVKIENTQKKIYDRMKNPYFPDRPGLYLAYLDVWERHVTSFDDSFILEQALGGIDTTTRTKVVWQVKLANVSADLTDGEEKCVSNIESWSVLTSSPTGKLQARSKPPEPAVNACSLIESAGYQSLENQLYRVEVHNGGTLADGATFKWSRDNGTVVTNVVGFNTSESKILIEERSKDKLRDFEIGQWIEVTDNLHEWLGVPGTLVRIKAIKDKENTLTYDATTTIGDAITEENFPAIFKPKVRRWDSRKDDNSGSGGGAVLISSNTKKDIDGYIDLEDGVQIRLDDEGNYRADDYWLIPARTKIGDIEWPRAGNRNIDEPLALLPEGVQHDYAPLAIVEYTKDENTNDGSFDVVADCRNFFSSLSDFVSLQYVGGDGQQALPGNLLQAPLQVGVMEGKVPINHTPLGKVRVKFTIVQSNTPQPGVPGKLKSIDGPSSPLEGGAEIVIETNEEEGIARCTWELGDSPSQQQVKAVLLDECGNETDDLVPIYFNATLPISFYYIRDDGQEAVPGRTIDLAAGVRIGNAPVTSGYKVKFEVQPPGNGTLSASEVPIDADGIARCEWILENNVRIRRQQVRAVLLFENSTPTNLPPIYFNATLPISFYYIRGDGQEVVVSGASVETIDLAAGVKIGNAPVTSGYKVKFEVQPPGNGTLSASEVPIDADGIARCEWTLENNPNIPRQQVRAVLLFENSNRTNLPPIYFNAGFAIAIVSETNIEQRWTHGNALNVENPAVGTVQRSATNFFNITIQSEGQSNWILASVPTPNVTEGWKVKAVMLRYRIFCAVPNQLVGAIFDSVGILDGNLTIPGFTGLKIGMPDTGMDTGWKTAKLELPVPKNFQFGLGVSIQANHIRTNLGNVFPAVFSIASVGLEFIK